MLIPIFTTHFRDTFSTSPIQPSPTSLWAQFMYFILFYSFKHSPSPCDLLGEIEEVWFGGYGSVPFGLFAWAQPMHATKWVRDTNSTSGSWKRSCIQNFHPKTVFMLWVTMAQSFCPNPLFPLNIIGSHWPTPSTGPHLGEPPNGLKFLTKGNQLKKTHFISKIMLKAYEILP